MKNELIKCAKTIEEAIEEGCKDLNVQRSEVSVEVLQVPKKGFLGLGQIEAQVKVVVDKQETDKLAVAKKYLTDVLEKMGIENFDINTNEQSEKKVVFTLQGDDLAIAIGKRGDTLNALQQLCSIVANMSGGEYYTVIVDAGNYRECREKTLQDLAHKISKTCLRSRRKIYLEPMNAYERKVIHEVIQNIDGVESTSKGEEPHRYITVFPVGEQSNNENRIGYNKNYKNKREPYRNKGDVK